jgi:hypothetical protein
MSDIAPSCANLFAVDFAAERTDKGKSKPARPVDEVQPGRRATNAASGHAVHPVTHSGFALLDQAQRDATSARAGLAEPDQGERCATSAWPGLAAAGQAEGYATSAWSVEPGSPGHMAKPSGECPSPPGFSPGVVVTTQGPLASPDPNHRDTNPGHVGSNPSVLATPQRPAHSILAIAQWTMQDIGAATPATEVCLGLHCL